MSETATDVEWVGLEGNDGLVYRREAFFVRVRDNNWWAHDECRLVQHNYAPDHATAKRDAERWIFEREGRLPAPATDGGGWIACSERMPDNRARVLVQGTGYRYEHAPAITNCIITHWRPLPVDPHAVAACLFGDERPTLEQARAATLHVAGCAECRAKLEAKGGG